MKEQVARLKNLRQINAKLKAKRQSLDYNNIGKQNQVALKSQRRTNKT